MLVLLATAALGLPANLQQSAGAPEVRYELTLGPPREREVRVAIAVSGLEPGTRILNFSMSRRYAYVVPAAPVLADEPVCLNPADRELPVKRTGPFAWQMRLMGNTSVRVEYAVPVIHRNLPGARENHQYEQPFVASDHALLNVGAFFMVPYELPDDRIRVRFQGPEGWPVLSAWPKQEAHYVPDDWKKLYSDVVAFGRWETEQYKVGPMTATLAFAPGQRALVGNLGWNLQRVLASELSLFQRVPYQDYHFYFVGGDSPGTGGTPKETAMILHIHPDVQSMAEEALGHLIAHEFFHLWAKSRYSCPDELRWVNEGFTDYYAYLIPSRLGIRSWEDFGEQLDTMMTGCAQNPLAGKMSLLTAGGPAFFEDADAHDLVYEGGALLAAATDLMIMKTGRGKRLDDFMQAFNNDPLWEKRDPTLQDFWRRLGGFVAPQDLKLLRQMVTRPYAVDPVALFGAQGVRVERDEVRWDGMFRAHMDGTRVASLDPKGGGWALGIRPHDVLKEVNGLRVRNEEEVRRAMPDFASGRARVLLQRGGRELSLAAPVPRLQHFTVDGRYWGPR